MPEFKRVEYTYRTYFSGGAFEQYVVSYRGGADIDMQEKGEAASLFHPFDTRQCFWQIHTWVARETFSVSLGGKRVTSLGDGQAVYTDRIENKGSDLVATAGRPENCGDCRMRRDSDWNNKYSFVINSFQELVDADRAKYDTYLKDLVNAERVERT